MLIHLFYVQNMLFAFLEMAAIFVCWIAFMLFIRDGAKQKTAMLFFALACGLVGYMTLNRSIGNSSTVVLTPLITFYYAKTQPEFYRTMFMNMVLFLPFGLSLPFVFKKGRKHIMLKTVLASLAFSVFIEFLQYVFGLGRCETDDVIMNVLGALIGSLAFYIHNFAVRKIGGALAEKGNNMNYSQIKLIEIVKHQIFGKEIEKAESELLPEILKEANAQTVLTTVFPYLQNDFKEKFPQEYAAARNDYLNSVYANTSNLSEHAELHKLMTENEIPYVVLKGFSSAYYYPDPSLRTMGDVDFIVYEKDFEKAKAAVESIGFECENDNEDGIHISFKREPMSTWEQHREINGIPEGEIGEAIKAELENVIENARPAEIDGNACLVPSVYHHGIIILLHIIKHLKNEGIGLRHLCDWAVFANSLGNDEFSSLFEAKFKALGLWKFAQIMTLISIKYLGADDKEWAYNPEIDNEQLEDILADVINGGNFGKKDFNRYREIKYISDRDGNTVESGNIFAQLAKTVNQKVYENREIIRRHRILLPVGWVIEGAKYAGLLISGQRKNKGTADMLKDAAKRKDIYSKMELFKPE